MIAKSFIPEVGTKSFGIMVSGSGLGEIAWQQWLV